MSEIKLIVTDLDGTLLDDNHQVNPEFWDIQKELAQKNIQFAIASGRQYYTILKQFQQIKDEIYILGDNGTFVKKGEKEVFLNSMPLNEARNFIKISRNIPNIDVILCGKNAAYIQNKEPKFYQGAKVYFENLKIVDDLLDVEDTILKVSIVDFINVETNSYPYLKEFENEFKIAIAGEFFIDITRQDGNKGTGIKVIQDILSINYDQTLVFGDMLNDLEMMQVAKYSYAMKNAHKEIKKIANFETDFNNNDNGVLEQIKTIFSLKEKNYLNNN